MMDTVSQVIGSLVTCFLTLSLKPEKGLMMEFFKEFSGTIIMVICTFTPGPFFGHLNAKGTYQVYTASYHIASHDPTTNHSFTLCSNLTRHVCPMLAHAW